MDRIHSTVVMKLNWIETLTATYSVSLFKEELGQVGSILSCDTGNKGNFAWFFSSHVCW